jgi:hypothetical protein
LRRRSGHYPECAPIFRGSTVMRTTTNALWSFLSLSMCLTPILFAQKGQSPDNKQRPVGGAVGVVTTPNGSEQKGVPPWEITDEERIARRTGSRAGDGRAQSLEARSGYSESIDGREHPELLFSYELFDHLLWGLGTDSMHHDTARRLFDAKIRARNYDVDAFWAKLASIAEPYLKLKDEHRRENRNATIFTSPTGKVIFVPIDRDVCAARLGALQEARRAFGGKDFDRFLYLAVAPEVGRASGSNAGDRAEQLRYIAGGCK